MEQRHHGHAQRVARSRVEHRVEKAIERLAVECQHRLSGVFPGREYRVGGHRPDFLDEGGPTVRQFRTTPAVGGEFVALVRVGTARNRVPRTVERRSRETTRAQ